MCGLCEGFPDYKDGGALALNERLTLREHILWTNFEALSPKAAGLVLGDDARGPHFLPADYFAARTDDSGTTAAIGTIFTPSLSGNQAVDALLAGTAWTMSIINYAFPTSPSDYPSNYGDGEPQNNFEAATLEFQQAIRYILEGTTSVEGGYRFVYGSVESFTLVDFVETSASQAIIKVASSADPGTAWGYYPWTDEEGGDIWFNNAYAGSRSVPYPQIGDYNWHTAIHELGHALGLKHGHETDGLTGFPVPAFMDSLEYTVMTYRSYVGGSTSGGYTNETWGFPQTWMMLDIAALQQMYGADFTVNSTDTTYTWNPSTGEMSLNGVGQGAPGGNRIFLTIWDGGGNDTYDFSNYTSGPVTVDLAPGGYSIASEAQLANLGNSNFARGNVFNALLYQGDTRSLIENAIGTFWGDMITGNQANNRLEGRENFDNLNGAAGNDTIIGGADNDFLNGGSGNDTLYGDEPGDFIEGVDVLNGGDGDDIIWGRGSLDNLIGGAGADTIYGGDASDDIDGGDGADVLYGSEIGLNDLAGDDILGGAGDDQLHGLQGDRFDGGADLDRMFVDLTDSAYAADFNLTLAAQGVLQEFAGGSVINVEAMTFHGSSQADTVTAVTTAGTTLADQLYGGGGDDVLNGGVSDDFIAGEAGIDTLNGGNGTDTVTYADAASAVTVNLGSTNAQNTQGAGSDTITNVENATGSAFNDTLTGNGSANTLSGGDGNDNLNGQTGADTLDGGAGDDILDGGAGADTTSGGLGDDLHYVDNAGDIIVETAGQGTADRVLSSVSFTLAADDEIELFTTTNSGGTDAINFTGNAIGQRIIGNAASNTLSGLDGNDELRGLDGNDILIGGNGDDLLLGGNGADTFLFNAGLFGNDTVSDFSNGADLIQLSGIAGVDDFSDLAVSSNGSGFAVITLPDGSTITLNNVAAGLVDASDFVFGP